MDKPGSSSSAKPPKFDPGKPKVLFTGNFLKNHVFIGSDSDKKQAEKVFLRRGKDVSTVIVFNRKEFAQFAGEVFSRQEDYKANPRRTFRSEKVYTYWSRGGDTDSDKKRAKPEKGKILYGVEPKPKYEGIHRVNHLEGMM